MSRRALAVVVLAAGKGTRMKSARPKVMHPLAGRPMVAYLLDTARSLEAEREVVILGEGMAALTDEVAPAISVVQDPPQGTADAVKCARAALEGFTGDVLILYADTPFVSASTLTRLIEARGSGPATKIAVLGMRPADPGHYGRLVLGDDGGLDAIVEARDATAEELAIGLCNSGVMIVDSEVLFELLDAIGADNSQGEYYLTDIVAYARVRGHGCAVVEAAVAELRGINSRGELAEAEAQMQGALRDAVMAGGATLIDPASVTLSHDTRLGRDVTIEPHVVFGAGVVVGDGVTVRAFSHIEGTVIAEGATVGPFARLRPGAEIGAGAHIGNFVEVKKSRIEQGAKVNHLTYIGDARVGAAANVGAGTITCNYDGYTKSHTDIGAGAFIGSNASLVAPVSIGDGAVVGAGSVITRDVDAGALGITRAPQEEVAGFAERVRRRKAAASTDAPSPPAQAKGARRG